MTSLRSPWLVALSPALVFAACAGSLARPETEPPPPVAAAAASAASAELATTAAAAEASPSAGGTAGAGPRERDPWEGLNRKVFWFNDQVDVWVLEPVGRGWDRVAPDPVQRSVSNFFVNLRFPIVAGNDLLQGKARRAGIDTGRFLVNTTVGVAGFFDPATGWGLVQHQEDFGQTLGWWGLGSGPYLVLPLLGPSSPRDTVGLIGDYGLSVVPFFVDQYILWGARVADIVNARSLFLREVEEAKGASFDYYSFVRNAYFQRRKALVSDQAEMTTEDAEDLYHPDLGEED